MSDLARALAHEPALLDRLERPDSPPLVQRLEDLRRGGALAWSKGRGPGEAGPGARLHGCR